MASVTDSYTNIQSNLNSSEIQTSNNRSEIKVDEVADNSLLIREITKDYNMGNNIGYSSNLKNEDSCVKSIMSIVNDQIIKEPF
jgi:hypothetical protein